MISFDPKYLSFLYSSLFSAKPGLNEQPEDSTYVCCIYSRPNEHPASRVCNSNFLFVRQWNWNSEQLMESAKTRPTETELTKFGTVANHTHPEIPVNNIDPRQHSPVNIRK